jgi:hypothetical protein
LAFYRLFSAPDVISASVKACTAPRRDEGFFSARRQAFLLFPCPLRACGIYLL